VEIIFPPSGRSMKNSDGKAATIAFDPHNYLIFIKLQSYMLNHSAFRPLSQAIGCKAMICTALRLRLAYEYIVLVGTSRVDVSDFVRPGTHFEQSLTARSGATIVAYASQLGGYIQIGAGSPPGVS
jgi:hypothetical protein